MSPLRCPLCGGIPSPPWRIVVSAVVTGMALAWVIVVAVNWWPW